MPIFINLKIKEYATKLKTLVVSLVNYIDFEFTRNQQFIHFGLHFQ